MQITLPYFSTTFFPMKKSYEEILHFWFEELTPADWYRKNQSLDEMIRHRFGVIHKMARSGELFAWRNFAEGRLAEIIVLDQFSRNIFRGTPRAFENDIQALTLAQELVHLGLDQKLPQDRRIFAYMPFMHCESKIVHEEAIRLFQSIHDEDTLKYEFLHKRIIDEFGRFPHRNKILGRSTTMKEAQFLKEHPGF